MPRRIVAILILLSVIGSYLSPLFIRASFSLNRKYIASNLCENRDKPWMHCDGKCFLMKKLRDAEEKEKREAQESVKLQQFVAVVETSSQLAFFRIHQRPQVYPRLPVKAVVDRSGSIFHPPCFFI